MLRQQHAMSSSTPTNFLSIAITPTQAHQSRHCTTTQEANPKQIQKYNNKSITHMSHIETSKKITKEKRSSITQTKEVHLHLNTQLNKPKNVI